MIQIDMNRKHNMNVINKSFHLENDVLVLAVKPLEYDLEGKTITAVFEPSKVETGALEVVNGLIQLPINNALVQPGVNYIQFNFRWGETKLEQSGKLTWVIDKSLETNSPAQEDVDIISYLISEINASKVTVDRMVDDAGDVKLALDASVEQAGESKTALDGSVTLAGTMKDELDGSITSATNINNALADPVDGTMKQANDSRVALEGKITDAGTAKSEIEQAIVDNQIVKQSEFTEHKLDYANQHDLKIKNEIKNGDFNQHVFSWNSLNSSLSVAEKTVSVIGNGTAINPRIFQNYSFLQSNVYHMRLKASVTNDECAFIRVYMGSTNQLITQINNPNKAEQYSVSENILINSTAPAIFVRHDYATAEITLDKVMTLQEFTVMNLTATFGPGNEPTKKEMDLLIDILGGWFDGEITLTQKQIVIWTLNMIRQNRNAITALGGTII